MFALGKGNCQNWKEGSVKVGQIIRFFHIDCAFQTFLKSKLETNVIRDINEIDGIEFIPSEVKSCIENLIADTIKWIKMPLVKPAAIINKSVLTLGSSVPHTEDETQTTRVAHTKSDVY